MDAFSGKSITFPLALACCGEEVRIVAVNGGRGTERKLADLGLFAGGTVTVMNTGGGPILLARGDGRVGIDAAIAFRILVSRVGTADMPPQESAMSGVLPLAAVESR